MFHLFVECRFIKGIWKTISKELNLVNPWDGDHIANYFHNWLKKKENGNEIPCFICWEVWKQINLVIFEDLPPNLVKVSNCILQDLGELKFSQCLKIRRIDRPPILD
jgi:hypothetical protein